MYETLNNLKDRAKLMGLEKQEHPQLGKCPTYILRQICKNMSIVIKLCNVFFQDDLLTTPASDISRGYEHKRAFHY